MPETVTGRATMLPQSAPELQHLHVDATAATAASAAAKSSLISATSVRVSTRCSLSAPWKLTARFWCFVSFWLVGVARLGASDLTNYNGDTDADGDVSAAKACFPMNWGSGGSFRIAIATEHGTQSTACNKLKLKLMLNLETDTDMELLLLVLKLKSVAANVHGI
ncbi:hypothetical protein ACLKA7_011513 [Drosophila subpalustris]